MHTLLELYVVDLGHPLAEQARGLGIEVVVVDERVLAAISETVTPQGIVGVAPLLDVPLDQAVTSAARLVSVLESVSDPGNAGTVIRATDAAGGDAVVLTRDSVDPHNGKCVRASAGSLWHLPVVSGAGLEESFELFRRTGMQVLGTTAAGAEDLEDLADAGALARPTAWLFGRESSGLSEQALAACDLTVRIPLRGRAESLNLATAAAVCLYTSARAQRGLQ